MSRHKCNNTNDNDWAHCAVCGGRIHENGCKTRKVPGKDCPGQQFHTPEEMEEAGYGPASQFRTGEPAFGQSLSKGWPKTMKFAHVGWTGSTDDRIRLLEALTIMEKISLHSDDNINLNSGRDFLKETKCYDVVILHFIFRGGFLIPRNMKNELAVSPDSSWFNWRRRLVATGAKWIFAFGGAAEVGGTFLVNLDGYKTRQIRTENIAAFGKPEGHDGLWVFEKL